MCSLSLTKYTAGGGDSPSYAACEVDKVHPWSKAVGAEGAMHVEQCMCSSSTCSAGSTCSSKATTMATACSCTPSATTICYEMKSSNFDGTAFEGKIFQMMSIRPGCFVIETPDDVGMSVKIGCAATGTDAQMQMFKGKGCAAGSELTDAEAIAADGLDSTAIMPLSSAWVNVTDTTSIRYSSTCYGGVQHADTGTATAAANAAANAAPAPALGSGEFSAGSSLSVGLAVGVLVTAAAFANLL